MSFVHYKGLVANSGAGFGSEYQFREICNNYVFFPHAAKQNMTLAVNDIKILNRPLLVEGHFLLQTC